jgi:hypothetical protein
MWNAECGMRNAECGMWNVECGMRNVECGMWNAEFGKLLTMGVQGPEARVSQMWNVECGMWNVECGMRNSENYSQRLPKAPMTEEVHVVLGTHPFFRRAFLQTYSVASTHKGTRVKAPACHGGARPVTA